MDDNFEKSEKLAKIAEKILLVSIVLILAVLFYHIQIYSQYLHCVLYRNTI